MHIHTMLHPTDFSPESAQAFELACSLARDHQARLVLMHAMRRSPPIAYPGVAIRVHDEEALRGESERKLQELQARANDVVVDRRLVLNEDAAPAIVETALAIDSDLIVMGTHGRTGFERLVLGSVAEQVLRKASCPVLTVKTTPSGSRDEPLPANH